MSDPSCERVREGYVKREADKTQEKGAKGVPALGEEFDGGRQGRATGRRLGF